MVTFDHGAVFVLSGLLNVCWAFLKRLMVRNLSTQSLSVFILSSINCPNVTTGLLQITHCWSKDS